VDKPAQAGIHGQLARAGQAEESGIGVVNRCSSKSPDGLLVLGG